MLLSWENPKAAVIVWHRMACFHGVVVLALLLPWVVEHTTETWGVFESLI